MSDLFEYLKDVLYSPEEAKLDLADVPSDQQQLAKGLICLNEYMKEEKDFAEGLSRGDLDIPLPASDNPLTGELRDLQGALSHLVWQAEQVTKGDYSQRLDFMGQLSEVFNDMIEALDDRETRLQHEAKVIQRQNERLSQSQVLLTKLMELMEDWVVVSSQDDGSIYHMNQACQGFVDHNPGVNGLLRSRLGEASSLDAPTSVNRWEFSFLEDGVADVKKTYEVTSQAISWDKKPAVVSIFHDVTREREVEYFAYHDSLTGLYNRRYAIEEMSANFAKKRPFKIAFIDLDGLKYVNDEFGHDKGNVYILDTIREISKVSNPKTVCRMGGDEFLIISYAGDDIASQLDEIRTRFGAEAVEWPQSFSYGISESSRYGNDLSPMINVAAMLEEADSVMYRYKVRNKADRKK